MQEDKIKTDKTASDPEKNTPIRHQLDKSAKLLILRGTTFLSSLSHSANEKGEGARLFVSLCVAEGQEPS